MKPQYATWIATNVPNPLGCCRKVTKAMAAVFPELTRVRGHYYCLYWGERAHWWLYDPDGDVIDPTAMQFPSKGEGHYEQWDESQPEPTGICPQCGEYAYDGMTCCSNVCSRAYAAYCMNP